MDLTFRLPDTAYRLELSPVEGSEMMFDVNVILSEEFDEWATEHNITDYAIVKRLDEEADGDDDCYYFGLEFKRATDAVMFKLAWGDKY